MTKMALIIGIVAVVLVGAVLFAGFHARSSFAHGGSGFIGCMVDKFADKLELRADQREKLMQMAEEVKSKHQEMHSLHLAARQEVISELRKETIDKEKIDTLFNDAKSRFDEIYDLFSTRFIAFHQTLTPEQRETLITEMEKHRGRQRGFQHRW